MVSIKRNKKHKLTIGLNLNAKQTQEKLLVKVLGNNIMQKAINNATHVFVLKLEGVLVGASETSHILKVGRGDWQ